MKYLVLLISFFLTLHVQAEWRDYQVDDYITVLLPSEPEYSDTLEMDTYYAESDFGLIYITRLENSQREDTKINMYDSLDLFSYYRGSVKTIVKQDNCTLLDSVGIYIDDLIGVQILYRFDFPDSTYQIRETVFLYYHGFSYSFNYINQDYESDTLLSEKSTFFSSLLLSDLVDSKLQLDGKSKEFLIGELIGEILAYLIIPIVILVVFLLRRKKKKSTCAQH